MSSKTKEEKLEAEDEYYGNESKRSVQSDFDQSSNDSDAEYSDNDVKPDISDGSSDSDDSDNKPLMYNNDEVPIDIPPNIDDTSQPESWPTIAILPGGVIKNENRKTTRSSRKQEEGRVDEEGSLYACAKCPARFNDLMCLTKHIKTHSEVKRKASSHEWNKLTMLEQQLLEIKRSRLDMEIKYYRQKSEMMSRLSNAMTEIGKFDDILDIL